jgi:hypothetical protein
MGTQTDNAGAQGASNLVVIAGHWNIKKSRAVYEGPEQQNMPYGICVSDLRFSEGKAWVTVTRTKDVPIQARILLAYRSQQHEYLSAGLGGGGGAYAIVRYVPPFGWHPLTADGSEKSLPPVGQPIVICARIQGQQISLEIDDVPVLEHVLSAPLPYGQLGLYTWGTDGGVEFTQLSAKPAFAATPTEVFIVHGHDDHSKLKVRSLIERAGLTPVILHEQPNAGRTIIEKFETHGAAAGFAVVVLTPDDVGGCNSNELKFRARQNVIGEMFWFAGKLGRSRICPLKKGDIEVPSDFLGVVYTEMDEEGAWQAKLLKELEAAGYKINWARAMA